MLFAAVVVVFVEKETKKCVPVGKHTSIFSSNIVGITGGSHYSHPWGAVEYLCLSKNPEWGLHIDGAQCCNGYIYGTEYRLYSFSHRSYSLYEVPCAVCEVFSRTKRIMIPDKHECYVFVRQLTGRSLELWLVGVFRYVVG